MGEAETAGAVVLLRRLLRYAEKSVELSGRLDGIGDRRQRPRIPTGVILRSVLVMFLARLGSLHALEQTQESRFWRRWLGRALPSADSIGRILALVEPDDLRRVQQELYVCLKRKKALSPTSHGLMALVIDGHESHASYRRRCSGCLERSIKTKAGWRRQYYHQHVTALLVGRDFSLLLDVEPLRREGEEVDAALRLVQRLLHSYPRAFDVVVGDALYSDARLYNLLLAQGKDVLTVLKRNRADLLQDAQALFDGSKPSLVTESPDREIWDLSGFTTWPELGRPVRVVRSRETSVIRRQLDGADETLLSQWLWVTTLSQHRASSLAIVELGHARWDIENRGFNETVNRWHFDHIYKHDATAIVTFGLLAMIAYNLFHTFYHRNLKPAVRSKLSYQHVARCAASELYQQPALPGARPP